MEIQGYNMPDDLYYEENHYWIRVEGDVLVMGMDDFAQQLAGEIVYVQLPFEGKKLKKARNSPRWNPASGWVKFLPPSTASCSKAMRNWNPVPHLSMKIATVKVGCIKSSRPIWLSSMN
jgi:hypothetical protein